MNTATNEVKVNPDSYDELSTQILPEDTPLIFQWLPRSFGNSVPNNKYYQYLPRLVDWSEREPQRKIYLVVNGVGLKQEQIEKLREDLKPTSNIQVVDYQEVSKEEGFEHLKVPNRSNSASFKLSALLAQIYDQQSKVAEILHFVDFLDAMRLEIILNIEKITSRKDAIYFDFDVRPKDGQKIGPISIPGGILLSSEADRDNSDLLENRELENSIIGVNGRSQNIIKSMCKYVEQEFHYYRHIKCGIPPGKVYHAMQRVMQLLLCHQPGVYQFCTKQYTKVCRT